MAALFPAFAEAAAARSIPLHGKRYFSLAGERRDKADPFPLASRAPAFLGLGNYRTGERKFIGLPAERAQPEAGSMQQALPNALGKMADFDIAPFSRTASEHDDCFANLVACVEAAQQNRTRE